MDDVDVSRWVLELLLRDREKYSLAKRVLAVAPLSDHDLRLKKIILLRSIESQILDEASVDESILDSLESIERLDRQEGVTATAAMKAAYCAVATEMTVKFLVCSDGKATGNFKEAVDRVWRGRVRVLEETEGCALVAAEARKMRDELEAGIRDERVSRKLGGLNSRNDALRAVAVYVKEAMAMLGSPFIAWAVRFHAEKGREDVAVANEDNVGPVPVAEGVDLEVRTVNIEENDDNVRGGGGAQREDGDVALMSEEETEETNSHGSEREARHTIVADVSDPQTATVAFINSATVGSEREAPRTIVADVSYPQAATVAFINSATVGSEREAPHTIVADVSDPQAATVAFINSATVGSEREAPRTIVADVSDPQAATVAFINSATVGSEREAPHTIVANMSDPQAATVAFINSATVGSEREACHTFVADVSDRQAVTVAFINSTSKDDEDVGRASAGIYNSVSIAEVQNMQENLKSCKASGTDPLPYALGISETLRPEDHDSKGNGSASYDVPQPIGNDRENAGKGDINPRNASSSHQNVVTRASLMVRNNTAHTYEWDDSPEQTNSRGQLHLPSRKRFAVSPVKKYEDISVTKRRKAKRWSLQEEDAFRTGVQKHGAGNWKLILTSNRDVFGERTEVDLKDKWRNMTK